MRYKQLCTIEVSRLDGRKRSWEIWSCVNLMLHSFCQEVDISLVIGIQVNQLIACLAHSSCSLPFTLLSTPLLKLGLYLSSFRGVFYEISNSQVYKWKIKPWIWLTYFGDQFTSYLGYFNVSFTGILKLTWMAKPTGYSGIPFLKAQQTLLSTNL